MLPSYGDKKPNYGLPAYATMKKDAPLDAQLRISANAKLDTDKNAPASQNSSALRLGMTGALFAVLLMI